MSNYYEETVAVIVSAPKHLHTYTSLHFICLTTYSQSFVPPLMDNPTVVITGEPVMHLLRQSCTEKQEAVYWMFLWKWTAKWRTTVLDPFVFSLTLAADRKEEELEGSPRIITALSLPIHLEDGFFWRPKIFSCGKKNFATPVITVPWLTERHPPFQCYLKSDHF